MDDSDRIEIRGLEVLAFCGVLPEERQRRQPFRIDLDLHVDLTAAGASDDLADTVDYGTVVDQVTAVVTDERFTLLERMAQRVAEVALHETVADGVTVRATKLRPPLPAAVDTTGVRIHRSRR